MFLPQKIKAVLEQNRLYIKLRYHKWIHAFWLLIRADVRKELSAKKAFYRSVLPHNYNLIFDIGANEGALTDLFSKHAKMVIAVEPSRRNVAILSAKFINRKQVVIVPKAVSRLSGYQDWYEDKFDYAMGTLSRKWSDSKPKERGLRTQISTIALDDLIQQYGVPDYIKIDVEGYEWQVLQGLSHSVPLLSFEAILPLFLNETILCINQLLILNAKSVFNYNIENKLAYSTYQTPNVILRDIKDIRQTVDIFCRY